MLIPRIPRGVGYWGEGAGSGLLALPRPQTLVRPGWHLDDRERIVAYLQSGTVCVTWAGRAPCRFTECGRLLGSSDLTDGQWLWPKGLEHYVVAHDVCLPEAFVETMRANGWQVSPALDRDGILTALVETGKLPLGDLSYWRDWAFKITGPMPT
jgi:hypothetical protein